MSEERLQVGDKAPDFEMECYVPSTGTFGKVSSETIRREGRWLVLFFYPADFTFVCPTELADMAEHHDEIRKIGGEIVAVSTDTKFSHMAWRREEKLLDKVRFTMAADPAGRVSRSFGVFDDETGLDLRGTFIVSPEGRLVSSEVCYYNVGRNAAELVRKLRANAYLAGHPEEACPANWREGKKALRPGPELVGRVYEAVR